MKYQIILAPFFFLSLISVSVSAQLPHDHQHNRKIEFPDIPGYKTLKCDFHQHAIFSDGKVHPSIRVEEAIKDGLDAISITEHLEYQPHKDDIPHPNRNRAFELAIKHKKVLNDSSLIITNGVEITRAMPPGHCNAIFIEDANKILVDDPIEAFREAKRQGAFIFWNHPHWKGQVKDGVARLTDMHKLLIKEKLIHGVEIVNGHTFSSESIEIALNNDLSLIGSSDIHGLIDWEYDIHHGGHRPITLVFAESKTEESLKKALFDGKTAIWYKNTLIGKQNLITPLIQASLEVKSAKYIGAGWTQHKQPITILGVTIYNNSDAEYQLINTSKYKIHNNASTLVLPPHKEKYVEIRTIERLELITMTFDVLNTVLGIDKHAHIELDISVIKQK